MDSFLTLFFINRVKPNEENVFLEKNKLMASYGHKKKNIWGSYSSLSFSKTNFQFLTCTFAPGEKAGRTLYAIYFFHCPMAEKLILLNAADWLL